VPLHPARAPARTCPAAFVTGSSAAWFLCTLPLEFNPGCNPMPPIYELLERDHARVRDLLAKICEGIDANDDNAPRVLSVVRKELEIHMAFEEEVFYPTVRDLTGLDDEIDSGLEEHEVVKSFFEELGQLQPGSDDWTDAVEDLSALLEDHFTDEEGNLFPVTRARLDESVAKILGDRYAQMRHKAFAGS
jgi:hemerythrin superfamily protein